MKVDGAAFWMAGCLSLLCGSSLAQDLEGRPWVRHTIDQSSRGADGVRLADADGDGRLDIVTGWEEGGVVRICFNPGPRRAAEIWPAVTVGRAASVEDAVVVDLDGDGARDVVTCCEGKNRTVNVHWAPSDAARYADPNAWRTESFPATANVRQWMFCLPLQVDGRDGVDLVLGSKGPDAQIGWLEAPRRSRDLGAWRWHRLRPAGWIMSLVSTDLDSDGDLDVVFSDRKGARRGCYWLENPGPAAASTQEWKEHSLGGREEEVMFLAVADVDGDRQLDVLAATRGHTLLGWRRLDGPRLAWHPFQVSLPPGTGTAKAVAVADLDLDGRSDLVVTCENAKDRSGVYWLSPDGPAADRPRWKARQISGPQGIKYDLAATLDLDGDGDLDVITCEETTNLGVIWYENPTRGPASARSADPALPPSDRPAATRAAGRTPTTRQGETPDG